LLCLDDLQWVDETTAGWLTYLLNRLAGSGLCILATYRTEGKEAIYDLQGSFSRLDLSAEVLLSGLTEASIETLLERLPYPSPRSSTLAARIHNATGGNPFFVLETLLSLIENDWLTTPPAELPLAETVQDTIRRRLGRLNPVARQLLEAAAVISPDLGFKQLQETAGRSDLETADGLDELVNHQLLIYEDQYLFNHDLINQVAYLGLSPWRRRLLHRRAADVLLDIYLHKQKDDEFAAQIARHYDAAGEVEMAVQYYYQAGIHAWHLYAYDEAIDHLQQAIKLSNEIELNWREKIQYYDLLGESLKITGRFEAAHQAYNDCLKWVPENEYIQRAKIHIKLAGSFEKLYSQEQAEETYEYALLLLNTHPDHNELAWQQTWLEIHLARLGLLYRQAKPEDMQALLGKIRPVLDKAGTPEQRSQYYGQQVGMALRQERYAVSEKTIQIAEEDMKADLETGDPVKIASAKFGWGFILLWSGNLKAAEEPLLEALDTAIETGRLMTQLLCLVYLTCLCRLRGDVDGVRTYVVRNLEIAHQLKANAYIGAAYSNLAWLDWKDHKFDRAVDHAQTGVSIWGDYPYPFKWLAHWVLIAIHLHRNDLVRSVESARVLLDPKQQRMPDDMISAINGVVESWENGRVESTRKALKKAIELAQQRGYL
jgi:tetratricopeptide (TPR) repeat protein